MGLQVENHPWLALIYVGVNQGSIILIIIDSLDIVSPCKYKQRLTNNFNYITDNEDVDEDDEDFEFSGTDEVEEAEEGDDDECIDNEIHAGKIFATIREIELAYKRYGKRLGFAVRKKTHRKNGEGFIRSVSYCCNRQGKPSVNRNPAKQNKTNRCGCKAGLTARLINGDKWEVSTFHALHNHLVVSPSKIRMMPCYRDVPPNVKHRLDAYDQSGIKMHKSYISIVNDHRGYNNMTCTEKDCRNIIKELRALRLGEGAATAIIRYFMNKVSQKSNEHLDFYYAVDVDEEKHLKNVFWADSWCREAYKEFGDVVSFDTTYLTKKYNMPFAPFVGVNHHGQSILLGCGLLSDEQEETFVWLFNEWMKCMSGCPPRAIITDQAKAMQNAIKIVFPAARHRWCIWHIMSKVPEKFAMYSKREKIISTLQELIYDTQTPAEFETRWQKMLQKYSLEANKWLSDLYDDKERWIPCFVNDIFWAGMSSTQRSEGMNAFFGGFLQPKTSLKQFVEQFEQALRKEVEKSWLQMPSH
ncbi:protein FAR1-RELATED SEQUENCE 5-like [Papaver somniferum]|uniref:protein FAR1-RELATED SEQUENCE 5-like n=1 Tax=Papaver somniferum TaxID=3469 RepID=UPI000E700F5B|nr:protein FAR1-RELATED SEQUENCE 5-like [Papaver somniferum]